MNFARGRPVSRILYRPFRDGDDHSSRPAVADRFQQPTRTTRAKDPGRLSPPRGPYLALLLAGLAVPPVLPRARWALTPPFHPCPGRSRGRSVFCGAFPRVAPGGRYPPPFLSGVRTFLAPLPGRGHPAIRANRPSINHDSAGQSPASRRRVLPRRVSLPCHRCAAAPQSRPAAGTAGPCVCSQRCPIRLPRS